MQTDKNRCVVFVSLTGDEQINATIWIPIQAHYSYGQPVTPMVLQVPSVCTRLER